VKPGDTLDGRYTITERLGAGGMGEVYKATHMFLGSSRVIKVVHPHISGNEDAKDRFLREARSATKIQHPNVATLHDFATLPDGAHYMVWEYIEGENLAQRLRSRGTIPPRQAVRIAIQALRGLEAIHKAGIIHRDISPENLMITPDDEVKIIDLGVAKSEDTDAVSQTRTGIFVGKLRYASPEQLGFLPEGEKVDARADLYALAMVLVELLTGRPPYEAKSPHEYFMIHARELPPPAVVLPPHLPGSAALQAVLEKALARDRNQRYSTARDFAAALEEIERTLPDAKDMPTMAVPLDGDATLRVASAEVDTLHRDTIRTGQTAVAGAAPPPPPAQPTLRTPLPMAPRQVTAQAQMPAGTPAPPTLTDSDVAPPPVMVKGLNPAYAVGFIAIVILLIAGVLLWPRKDRGPLLGYGQTAATETTATAPAKTPPPPPARVAEASVTVTSPTTDTADALLTAPVQTTSIATQTLPPVTATTASTTTAPPVRSVPVEPVTPQRTPPKPQREPVAAPTATAGADDEEPAESPVASIRGVPTYTEDGDDDENERAIAVLRRELKGTTRVALRAAGMQVEVVRALREQAPDLEFAAYADVVIRFEGNNERLGRGRKRRAGTAIVLKHGRPIFRYEMPDEVYRVGESSAEAFATVIGKALDQ
jgi:serine/threonine protein kinase